MSAVAAGFAAGFATAAALGAPLIRLLRRRGVKQTISADAPARHAEKQGTPTMGGLLILAGVAAPAVWGGISRSEYRGVFPLLGLVLWFGMIGLADDLLIVRRGKNLGLKARHKLALQLVGAGLFALWLSYTAVPGRTSVIRLWTDVDVGAAYYALAVLLIVGLSNAMNFLDGLDGQAAGVCALIAGALGASVYASQGLAWLPLFGGALSGACAGFLWYNAHPAQVFMGDTGSLPLGAALAGMGILGKEEVSLQVFAIVPWAALISVMLQVSVFKYRTRKYGIEYARAHRLFRRTPIHHHFEELGWKETTIVQRFWLVTALAIGIVFALG